MQKRPLIILAASVLTVVVCPGISSVQAAQESSIRVVNTKGRLVFTNFGDHPMPVPSAVMRVPGPGPVVLKTVSTPPLSIPVTANASALPPPLPAPRSAPASRSQPVGRAAAASDLDGAPPQIGALVRAIARNHGVDPDLVSAVIKTESNFDTLAVSSKGARGLMQLIPETGRRFGVQDFFDPRQNIEGGVRYLRFLLDKFDGSVELSVAAYNAGEGVVEKLGRIPPYTETREYVRRVRTLYPNRIGWLVPSLEPVDLRVVEPLVEPLVAWRPAVERSAAGLAEVPAIPTPVPAPAAVAAQPVPEALAAASAAGAEESRIYRTTDARGVNHFSNVTR